MIASHRTGLASTTVGRCLLSGVHNISQIGDGGMSGRYGVRSYEGDYVAEARSSTPHLRRYLMARYTSIRMAPPL